MIRVLQWHWVFSRPPDAGQHDPAARAVLPVPLLLARPEPRGRGGYDHRWACYAPWSPIWARRRLHNHYAWRILVSVSLTTYSYLLVLISGGSIEMHFHFFMIMALLVIYSDWRINWLVLVLTALHHGILNYVHPQWVYFYGRNDFAIVAHGLPVAVTAVFTTLLCENQRRSVAILEETRRTQEEDLLKRREAEETLRESEEKSRYLIDAAADAIVSIDDQSRIREFNRAAERLFGFTAAEVAGEPLDAPAARPRRRRTPGRAPALPRDGGARDAELAGPPARGADEVRPGGAAGGVVLPVRDARTGLLHRGAARHHAAEGDGGGAGRRPRPGHRGVPAQIGVPRQHEPRDPHPDERHHRHDRPAARHRADAEQRDYSRSSKSRRTRC